MNKCARVRRLLSGYLDKETNERDAILVRTHLATCPSCQDELAALTQVKELVSCKERKTLPQDYLVNCLREEIARQQAPGTDVPWIVAVANLSRRLMPLPLTVIVVSVIFLLLISPQQKETYSLEEHMLNGSQITTEVALGMILGA